MDKWQFTLYKGETLRWEFIYTGSLADADALLDTLLDLPDTWAAFHKVEADDGQN